MSRWFRFYDSVLDDPKVQRLSDKLYRTWTAILCIACRFEGRLPSVSDMAICLNVSARYCRSSLSIFEERGLIVHDGSAFYVPGFVIGRDDRPPKREWDEIRCDIFKRDDFTCQYCGSRGRLECDHVIPVSKGGKTKPQNLVTACFSCNRSKGSKLLSEWLQ